MRTPRVSSRDVYPSTGSTRDGRDRLDAAPLVCTGGAVCGESGRGGTWRGSVQFSSVQFSSVQFSSVQFRLHARMHACTGSRRLALQNDARPHASAHCSPQPSPVAATSPTLESPFVGLSHAVNDAQQLLLLLADQCEQRQHCNPVAAQSLQTALAAQMDSCEALQLQHPSC